MASFSLAKRASRDLALSLFTGVGALLRGRVSPSVVVTASTKLPTAASPAKTATPITSTATAAKPAEQAPAMTQRERMLSGMHYYPEGDAELANMRAVAQALVFNFNQSPAEEEPEATSRRRGELLGQLLGGLGEGSVVEAPFRCDYGCHIHAGQVYIGVDVLILDCAPVEIGDRTIIGPGVHIYTATHPLDPKLRVSGRCTAKPVKIGSDVWIGGGAVLYPGVSVGDGSVIAAGSMVARDVPPGWLFAGNPARPIRRVGAPREQPKESQDSVPSSM